MPITPEEQAAIDVLRKQIDQSKIDTFEYLKTFAQMESNDDPMIRASGYKTREDAFIRIMKSRMQAIEAAIRAHEKRWPHA